MFEVMLAVALAPGYTWHQAPSNPRWYSCWRENACHGWYDAKSGEYTRKGATRPSAPPIPTPDVGVTPGRITDGEYTRKGIPCTREEAWRNVGADIPDRSKSPRITVVGPEEQRKRILALLTADPAIAAFAPLYDSYDAEHWAVKGKGFSAGGFALVVQSATGVVLHRQEDEADAAAGVLAALRDGDPNYNPKADPDRRKLIPSLQAIGKPPVGALILGSGAVLAALVFSFRSKP